MENRPYCSRTLHWRAGLCQTKTGLRRLLSVCRCWVSFEHSVRVFKTESLNPDTCAIHISHEPRIAAGGVTVEALASGPGGIPVAYSRCHHRLVELVTVARVDRYPQSRRVVNRNNTH